MDHEKNEGPKLISIIWDIRDSHLFKNADLVVMLAIASRLNWKKGYSIHLSYA